MLAMLMSLDEKYVTNPTRMMWRKMRLLPLTSPTAKKLLQLPTAQQRMAKMLK
jgi:hypothetical protein